MLGKVMPSNFCGFGTSYHGEGDFKNDGTYITTEWLVLGFIPVIPLSSHRLLSLPGVASEGDFGLTQKRVYVERVPLNWPQVLRVYLFLPLLAIFEGLVIFGPRLSGTAWGDMLFRQEALLALALLFLPMIAVLWLRRSARKRAGVDKVALLNKVGVVGTDEQCAKVAAKLFSKEGGMPFALLMRLYAVDVVNMAEKRLKVRLDYSEASLEAVDLLIQGYSGRKLLVEAQMTESQKDDLWTFCKALGAYVGEVIIRNLGGEWIEKPQPDGASLIALRVKNGLETAPADSMFRRFTEEYKGGAVSYYRAAKALVEAREKSG